ncbi:hypothetical protein K9O30_15000 [Clostridium bowmanii]|uniref:hypothetical protein n=1 Tax=Clostridium bowmanii TaxID=132925 RepID=UPI001C0C4A8F|nr:hypothetical protein [Clostridium bowmanii]MBU3190749.1 hypothetical protein [Clostridium bowmanii]MCA1075005.1 hypothetical protein [Clostridium bowmanii]
METLYCQCFCDFFRNIYYTSYLIYTVNEIFILEKIKRFEATNEYEALIKLINRIILKLETEYTSCLADKNVVFIINNEELINDLTSETKRANLDCSMNGLYKQIADSVKNMGITFREDFDEQLLRGTVVEDYSKFYKFIIMLYLTIRKSQGMNEEYYKSLSKYNMAIQDILHFIEFAELDRAKKIEYMDTIKKIRKKRRELKNEIEVLGYFSPPLGYLLNTLDMFFNLQESQNYCESLKHKQMFSTKEARKKLLSSL